MGCGASQVSPVVPAAPASPPASGAALKQAAQTKNESAPPGQKQKPPPLDIGTINRQTPSSPSDLPQPALSRRKKVALGSDENGEGAGGVVPAASQRSVRFASQEGDEEAFEEVKSFNPSPRTSHRIVSEEEAEEEDAIVAQQDEQEVKTYPLLGSWKGANLEVTFSSTGGASMVGDMTGILHGRINAESFKTTVFAGTTVERGIQFWLQLDRTGGLRGWYSAAGSETTGESWTGYKMRSGAAQSPGFEGVWIMSAADGEESRLALKVPPPPDAAAKAKAAKAAKAAAAAGQALNGDISISSLDEAARVAGAQHLGAVAASGTFTIRDDSSPEAHAVTRNFVLMQDFHGQEGGGTAEGDMQVRFWVDGGPGVSMWKSHVLHRVPNKGLA